MLKKNIFFSVNLKAFSANVFGSLVATFIWTYFFDFLKVGKQFNFYSYFEFNTSYSFIFYWFFTLAIFFLVPRVTRKIIDKRQTPQYMPVSFTLNHDARGKIEHAGFNWEIKINIVNQDRRDNKIKEVIVDRVEGPYCKNEFRTMECSRTLLGRFKYKCPDPECSSKIILMHNRRSLEKEIADMVEADYRKDILGD